MEECQIIVSTASADRPTYFIGCGNEKGGIFPQASDILQNELSSHECDAPYVYEDAQSTRDVCPLISLLPPNIKAWIDHQFQFVQAIRIPTGSLEGLQAVGMGTNKKKRERACKLGLALALAAEAGRLESFLSDHRLHIKTDFADAG